MQIQIVQACGIHGELVEVGETPIVDDPTAKMLIGIGRAIPFEPPPIQTGDPKPQTPDPKPQTQDPKPPAPGPDGKS